jgi:hypothetical protein
MHAVVHLELVDSQPKKSVQVCPWAPSQLLAQQFVIAVLVVAQQESKPEGFMHPAEGKVKEDWAEEREKIRYRAVSEKRKCEW